MNKQKVLEDLQKFARDISEKESMLRENNEKRLAEFLTVWRLMNFRFQDLIEKTDEDKIKSELESIQRTVVIQHNQSVQRFRINSPKVGF